MHRKFQSSTFLPSGLVVEGIASSDDVLLVTARAATRSASCPLCQVESGRVHSRYVRLVSDLPCSGRGVRLRLLARRFRCEAPQCRRVIFAERFDNRVLAVRSRRTGRLDYLVHHLGLALGGRPVASFANRLMLPVSNDTLLRVVRRRSRRPAEPLNIVGIDDWAFRRIIDMALSSAISSDEES